MTHADGLVLTVRQKLLLAAVALPAPFAVEDLVVRAWERFPESFALRGHEARHPDANRVLAKLSGSYGLCGLGWLQRTARCTYRVTRKGLLIAQRLHPSAPAAPTSTPSKRPPVVAPPPSQSAAPRAAAKSSHRAPRRQVLSDGDVAAIARLARGDLLRKFQRGFPPTFVDARAFWGLTSARPRGVHATVQDVGVLLARGVEQLGAEGAGDPRLPPLSVCYGLHDLHRRMAEKFVRELEALAAQGESAT